MDDVSLPSLDELMGGDPSGDTPDRNNREQPNLNSSKSTLSRVTREEQYESSKKPLHDNHSTDDSLFAYDGDEDDEYTSSDTDRSPKETVSNKKNIKENKRSKYLDEDGKIIPVNKAPVFDEEDEDDVIYEEDNENKKKGLMAAGIAALVGLLAVGVFTMNPFSSNDQNVGKDKQNTDVMPSDLASKLNNKTPSKVNFWETSGTTKYPIELNDWQLSPYNSNDSNILKNIRNKYANTTLAISSSRLPSSSQGFTSDPTKIKLDDGTLNPLYTSITSEDYQNAVESDIERLINPVFGNWKQFQYASGKANDNFRTSVISDMFTSDWLEKNANKKPSEYIPVYADWSANDYGMSDKLLATGPRWVGNVENMTSNFNFDSKSQQYNSDVTVNIKYSAWAKDESVLTKNGVLKLHIITKTNNGKKAQVLINGATLKVS